MEHIYEKQSNGNMIGKLMTSTCTRISRCIGAVALRPFVIKVVVVCLVVTLICVGFIIRKHLYEQRREAAAARLPGGMAELIARENAGIPADRISGFADWPYDPRTGSIHSSSTETASDGSRYCEW